MTVNKRQTDTGWFAMYVPCRCCHLTETRDEIGDGCPEHGGHVLLRVERVTDVRENAVWGLHDRAFVEVLPLSGRVVYTDGWKKGRMTG